MIKSKQKDKDDEIVVRSLLDVNNSMNENIESHLFSIPFDVLKTIMQFCVGVEYMKFRSTCKHCQLAGPMIQWSNGKAIRRLQAYSLASPLLVVFEKYQGIITFTDMMFGDKYFMKTPEDLIGDIIIESSEYGWLLIHKHQEMGSLMFFNPFTSDIHELPQVPALQSFCFTAPPTSPNCVVVGFTVSLQWNVYILNVGGEGFWRRVSLNFGGDDSHLLRFPIFCGQYLFTLYSYGGLDCFTDIETEEYFRWVQILDEGPSSNCESSTEYFLTKHDEDPVLVIMGEFGESIEVFKLNDSNKWEKMVTLGTHMICICGSTCLFIESKIPEMENKIYFPRLHSENEKIVFYSLETRRYHTFNGKNVEENLADFVETKQHLNPLTWIEPSWS